MNIAPECGCAPGYFHAGLQSVRLLWYNIRKNIKG